MMMKDDDDYSRGSVRNYKSHVGTPVPQFMAAATAADIGHAMAAAAASAATSAAGEGRVTKT